MSTALVTIPDSPEYLKQLLLLHPELAAINADALSGSARPMPPTIVADKGKFLIKKDGNETVITFPDTPQNKAAGIVGMPVPMLQAVVLKAKPGKEKAYYVAKYVPGQEATAPDCYSEDGVKPAADAKIKQCENCASCPQNVFGSGTNDSGEAKGKACADRKVIALFAAGGVYRFAVPPASLSGKRQSGLGMAWDPYCNQLSVKALPLPAVITTISFDQGDTDYKLNFNFGGMLAEQQLAQIVPLISSPEVQEIVLPRNAPAALPAPVTQAALPATPTTQVVDLAAEKAKKDAADAEKAEKAAKAKKAKDEKAAQAAATNTMDLGLGGVALAPATETAPAPTGNPSDDDLINSLGLQGERLKPESVSPADC